MTNVSMDSGSPCSSSGIRSAIDLFFGLRLSRTPTSPNWNDAVDEAGLLAELGGGGDREVDGERGAADAALGAEHRDDAAGLAGLALGAARPRSARR